MMPRNLSFLVATVTPAALVAAAAIMGEGWVIAAVVFQGGLGSLLDRLIRRNRPPDDATSATGLPLLLAVCHFVLLALCVLALSSTQLGPVEKLGLFFAAGLWLGQVSNANAHELIHRRNRHLFALGKWIYVSLLFGHHTSAHLLVHHIHVATPSDPNTARKGESLYRYLARAWRGSFLLGLRAENNRSASSGRAIWRHPYVHYLAGSAGFIILAFLTCGSAGTLAYVALCLHAQSQLLMSDYVQHYGLMRRKMGPASFEPVGPQHSWNSPHWFSSALLLNATRHSDHHTRPMQPYPALALPQTAPLLPRPLPVMATIALLPPLWRRLMDPRLPDSG